MPGIISENSAITIRPKAIVKIGLYVPPHSRLLCTPKLVGDIVLYRLFAKERRHLLLGRLWRWWVARNLAILRICFNGNPVFFC